MKLSVLLVCYDMAREIPRTLTGLARDYQDGARELEYEVLLVDNGSPVSLDPASWRSADVPVTFIEMPDPSPSPARAINTALARARGEIVCVMIDGAHILTPGVFRLALAAFAAFDNPVVATRYFWLGPDAQNVSIGEGYNQAVEDRLLQAVSILRPVDILQQSVLDRLVITLPYRDILRIGTQPEVAGGHHGVIESGKCRQRQAKHPGSENMGAVDHHTDDFPAGSRQRGIDRAGGRGRWVRHLDECHRNIYRAPARGIERHGRTVVDQEHLVLQLARAILVVASEAG